MVWTLLITAVVIPLEVALLNDSNLLVNLCIYVTDVIFVMDITLQFNIAYSIRNPGLRSESWEARPIKIAKRYMGVPCSDKGEGGWFWPDVLTLLPWDAVLELL